MKKHLLQSIAAVISPALVSALALLILVPFTASAQVNTAITTQLDRGESGDMVIRLQSLLATDSTIYPEALVTGYFGSLTEDAVERFQCREMELCSGSPETNGYGRVGPDTLLTLNAHIAATGTITGTGMPSGTDPSVHNTGVPVISRVDIDGVASDEGITNIELGGSDAVAVNWDTNEPTTGLVYYQQANAPILREATVSSRSSVQSTFAASDTGFETDKAVTLSGLQPNQEYYYVIESRDVNGNVSYTWPRSFTTQ